VLELGRRLGTRYGGTVRVVLTRAPWQRGERSVRDAAGAWLGEDVDGWTGRPYRVTDRDVGSYMTGTWRHESGARVEIGMTRTWTGADGQDPMAYLHAWQGLDHHVMEAWKRDRHAGASTSLLATPSTTGRSLWLASLSSKTEHPVLSDELRELLHATSGQGRIQVCTTGVPETVPGVAYLDGRLMYAALTWGLPVGAPMRLTARTWSGWTDAEQRDALRGGRMWLKVKVRIPADWDHVGILPARRDSAVRGWCYPDEPGREFTTWASGAEVWTAWRYRWDVRVVDGLYWAEGKPMRAFSERLCALWHAAPEGATRKMIRSLMLFTIGSFATSGRTEQAIVKTDDLDQEEHEDAAYGEIINNELTMLVKDSAVSDLAAATLHPEWAVMVWGRARARLLSHVQERQEVGALTLPRASVLGFHTDALMLDHDPLWPDAEGKIGSFRLKGLVREPVAAPRTAGDRIRLRDMAEAAMEEVTARGRQ